MFLWSSRYSWERQAFCKYSMCSELLNFFDVENHCTILACPSHWKYTAGAAIPDYGSASVRRTVSVSLHAFGVAVLVRSRRQATPSDGRGCMSPTSGADYPGDSVSQCTRERERETVKCSTARERRSDVGSCGATYSWRTTWSARHQSMLMVWWRSPFQNG